MLLGRLTVLGDQIEAHVCEWLLKRRWAQWVELRSRKTWLPQEESILALPMLKTISLRC